MADWLHANRRAQDQANHKNNFNHTCGPMNRLLSEPDNLLRGSVAASPSDETQALCKATCPSTAESTGQSTIHPVGSRNRAKIEIVVMLQEYFNESASLLRSAAQSCSKQLVADAISTTVSALGGKPVLVCRNGGSACDAMHIADERASRSTPLIQQVHLCFYHYFSAPVLA